MTAVVVMPPARISFVLRRQLGSVVGLGLPFVVHREFQRLLEDHPDQPDRLQLVTHSQDTFESLKKMIEKAKDIPSAKQQLLFQERRLDNHHIIGSYAITDQSVLQLKVEDLEVTVVSGERRVVMDISCEDTLADVKAKFLRVTNCSLEEISRPMGLQRGWPLIGDSELMWMRGVEDGAIFVIEGARPAPIPEEAEQHIPPAISQATQMNRPGESCALS